MLKALSRCAAVATLAAAAFSFAPQSASAMSFKYEGQKHGKANVNFTRAAPPGDKVETATVSAGIFSMTDVSDDGLGSFLAWCFDVDTNIATGPITYNLDNGLLNSSPPYLNAPNGGATTSARQRVQNLFDRWYDPSTILDNAAKSAGFQIAIWEVLYDDNYSIQDGSFKVNSGDKAARNAATAFLAGVKDYEGPQKWVINTYNSATNQDLGVATAIPLPAAVWLLLGVAGALVAGKRYSNRKLA